MFRINRNGSNILFAKNFILAEDPELQELNSAPVTLLGRVELTEEQSNKYLCEKAWFKYSIDWSKVTGESIPGTDLIRVTGYSSNALDCSISHVAIDPNSGPVDGIWTSRWVSDQNDVPNWYRRLRASHPSASIPVVSL